MPIVKNQTKGIALIRATANETITSANLVVANTGEVVTAMGITRIWWSGNTTIARGANTILVLTGTGDWNLAGWGDALDEGANSDIVITTTGTVLLEVKKVPDSITY